MTAPTTMTELAMFEPTACDLGHHVPQDPDENGRIICANCADTLDTISRVWPPASMTFTGSWWD